MEKLPAEIIIEILKKLDFSSFYAAALFCRSWNRVTKSSYLLIVHALLGTSSLIEMAKRIKAAELNYYIYCLECSNKSCRTVGLPNKCPKCGGKIRRDKTELRY